MTRILTNGYTRLLQKLGRSGRLTGMGHNDLTGSTSYTVQYAPGKTMSVTVQERDFFWLNSLDRKAAREQHRRRG